MLAAAEGGQCQVMAYLATSRHIWESVKFRSHVGHGALWKSLLSLRCGDAQAARAHLQRGGGLLLPLEDTLAWRWFDALNRQIEAA